MTFLRRNVCLVTFTLAFSGFVGRARAADDLSGKADVAVEAQRQAQKIPGVSLAVCRNGKIVKAAGYGLANVELDVPVRPETILPDWFGGEAVHLHGRDDVG